MRDGSSKKSKLSWTKTLVKKWFNIRTKAHDFHADAIVSGGINEEWRTDFSEENAWPIKKSKEERSTNRSSDRNRRSKINQDSFHTTDVHNYRIFAATWNVGGKSPPNHLNLDDWLQTSPPADIYVLGFQEIVPLNAGNVLGTEDSGPARKWLALIRKTLNSLPGTSGGAYQTLSPVPDPILELDDDFEGSSRHHASSFLHRRSCQLLSHSMRMSQRDMSTPQPQLDRRFSVCDRGIFANQQTDYDPYGRWCGSFDDENDDYPSSERHSPLSYSDCVSMEDRGRQGQSKYCLVASKQMVGIFLTVWMRSDLTDYVHNLKVSCVGCGLMGYLGNKGSISISMSLHQTSFCFICSHLTSGQKEGDELRRNADVMEIKRKTRFPKVGGIGDENSPQTILEHDRIIWLGDLNYRISLSYQTAKALMEMRNWRALLESDQLRMEQRRGHVFVGWNEGKIYFPPTYKYLSNSDRYAGDDMQPKEKQRTPAWCDRILWNGRGLHQISYVRGESRFSDHRPVCSIFVADVESINNSRNTKSMSFCSARVEFEELLHALMHTMAWRFLRRHYDAGCCFVANPILGSFT